LQFTAQGSYALRVSEGVLDGQAVSLGLLPASGQPPIAIGTTLDWRPGLASPGAERHTAHRQAPRCN
jgi:hypothetical protein